MNLRRRVRCASARSMLLVAMLVTGAGSVWAQSLPTLQSASESVLTGADVSERMLIEALSPSTSNSVVDPVESRGGILVQPVGTAAKGPTRAAASLLITFETNSAVLTAAARSQLDVVAAALKNVKLQDYRFNVEGHADPRGNTEANRMLSQQRAETVRDYLANSHGIASARLHPAGKGDSELMNRRFPAAPENRRVTFVRLAETPKVLR